jgi:signal transduction histidine kinase
LRFSEAENTMVPAHRRGPVVALVMIILTASFIYALVAIDTASELRTRSALDQTSAAAQISARLLDEQWQDLQVVIRELTNRRAFERDIVRSDIPKLQGELKYAVDIVPALMLAAVYSDSGTLISSYPDSPVAPLNANGTSWLDGARRTGSLYQSDSMRIRLPDQPMTEMIAVSLPVGPRNHPAGYMLVLYRVGDLDKWLNDLGLNGSDLYVVNARGQIVDASTGADRNKEFTQHRPFKYAMMGEPGSLISHKFYKGADADLGYAQAVRPGWAVIVARPVSLALAPTGALAGRLSLLGVLVLTLLVTGAFLILGFYRNQNRMALALSRQNAQLREADRVKSDFLANVSHDLRTPLAAIQLSVSSLLEPELQWEPEAARESLRVASDGLDQINSRVRNLLEMARIEARVWPLNKLVCDLTDVVASALERLKPLTAGRNLRLNFPERPLLLDCDQNQIETVIVNLLENAIKYSTPGTSISLTGSEHAGWITLAVQNEGPGIPVDELDRIFEKFYRSPSNASVGGTGLGLAICRSILDAHNGLIGARNTLIRTGSSSNAGVGTDDEAMSYGGSGAEFYFSLTALRDGPGDMDE